MKSYNRLIDYALTDECMDIALKKAIEKKTDRPEVKRILKNVEQEKKKLREKIFNHQLELYIHKARRINDGVSKKERIILEPFFTSDRPEQWLHHIVIETMLPILTKGMYDFTFGSIPNRGLAYGKKYVEKFIANNPKDIKYALEIDIRHFYENINPELLKQKFSKIIRDKEFLYLVLYNQYRVQEFFQHHLNQSILQLNMNHYKLSNQNL